MTRLGAWLDLPSPHVAEMLAETGFDFVVIDLEHGPMSLETAILALMAMKGTDCIPMLRVPEGTEAWIKRALDSGAHNILVPRVESAAQAEAIAQYFHYPPRGLRGSAQRVVRASGWGRQAAAYKGGAILALQIESVDGLNAMEEIAATPDIDMLFFGPADFAASCNVPVSDASVMMAAAEVARVAGQAGLMAGTVLFDGASTAGLAKAGMTHISVTGDVVAITNAFDTALDTAKNEVHNG